MGLEVQKIGINSQTAVKIDKKNNQTFLAAPVKKTSADLILGMTTAAATVVAGVALYKNHGTQKELKSVLEKLTKTENELKKVIEESKNNIKSAVEDVVKNENKETVNSAKKEVLENKKKHYSSGIHINNTPVSKEEKSTKKIEDVVSENLNILEDDAAAARKAKKASDRRNQEWLEKQHKLKEQEYSNWWNKTLLKQETKEGERILADDAANLRREKKLSDIRNQKWLDEQHNIKEQEMNQFYADNSEKFDELEKLADKRIRAKYEAILDNEEKEARYAKKASDRRNQEWLNGQHKQKEQEMNIFYARRSRKLKQLSKLADKRLGEKYEKLLDSEAAEKLKAKKVSDRRNQEWLESQHKLKEQEYSNWWNKTLFDKEAKDGEEVLKNDADAKIKAKKISDVRNQKWLNEQHDIKEQEMNQFYVENSEKLDKLEQIADERLAEKYETLMKEADIAEQQAKKASDKSNQKWLEKQHKLKEQEYSDWWNKTLFEKEAKEGERILEEDAAEIRKAKKASDRRNEEWLKEQHRIKEEEMNERYIYNDIEIQYIYFKAKIKNYVKSLIKRFFSKKDN